MAVGFVLINVVPTSESDVYRKLSETEEVFELHSLFGEYDLIAKIQTESFEDLADVIKNKIRSIEGIVDTKTLTGTKFLKGGFK